MPQTSEESLGRPLSKEEMEAIRRATRDEAGVFSDMWALLRRVGRHVPFAEDVLAAYYCARDPETDRKVKLTLVAALAYFVMPFDIIPDILPVIGFTDDAAVITAALAAVARSIRPEHRERARDSLKDAI